MDSAFPPLHPEIEKRAREIYEGRVWRGQQLGPLLDLDADDPDNPRELTVRETEVLALIAEGLTDQEIADRLLISIETVKTYVKKILRKTDARSRAAAVAYGFRHGILT